jgi:hypothetical protein
MASGRVPNTNKTFTIDFSLRAGKVYLPTRLCQQALLNRLEPILEPVLDEGNFGYRRGRSTKHAMREVWKEIQGGREWIVDADLKHFFGSVQREKLLRLWPRE